VGQGAEQYTEDQRLGSVEMFISDYGDTSFTSLGIGESFAYAENITPLDGTPDNGVKPIALDGIADQDIDVSGTLWTYKLSLISQLRGEIDDFTTSAVTGERRLGSGGKVAQKAVIIKAVNKTEAFATAQDVADWVTTPSANPVTFALGDKILRVMTTTFFKTVFQTGENITYTADKDGNPIMKYPFTMKGDEDATITDGSGNLFERVETVEVPA
jgi:hypothetical protein